MRRLLVRFLRALRIADLRHGSHHREAELLRRLLRIPEALVGVVEQQRETQPAADAGQQREHDDARGAIGARPPRRHRRVHDPDVRHHADLRHLRLLVAVLQHGEEVLLDLDVALEALLLDGARRNRLNLAFSSGHAALKVRLTPTELLEEPARDRRNGLRAELVDAVAEVLDRRKRVGVLHQRGAELRLLVVQLVERRLELLRAGHRLDREERIDADVPGLRLPQHVLQRPTIATHVVEVESLLEELIEHRILRRHVHVARRDAEGVARQRDDAGAVLLVAVLRIAEGGRRRVELLLERPRHLAEAPLLEVQRDELELPHDRVERARGLLRVRARQLDVDEVARLAARVLRPPDVHAAQNATRELADREHAELDRAVATELGRGRRPREPDGAADRVTRGTGLELLALGIRQHPAGAIRADLERVRPRLVRIRDLEAGHRRAVGWRRRTNVQARALDRVVENDRRLDEVLPRIPGEHRADLDRTADLTTVRRALTQHHAPVGRVQRLDLPRQREAEAGPGEHDQQDHPPIALDRRDVTPPVDSVVIDGRAPRRFRQGGGVRRRERAFRRRLGRCQIARHGR